MDQKENNYHYYPVILTQDLPPGERLFVEIGSLPIVIINIDSQYYALEDLCSHDDGPVGDGELEGFKIICPRHGARFDVRTGQVLCMPAVKDIHSYPVRVNENTIEVGLPE
jgi:3-phenylpropionate/trans-cinnamate dioxygenase ferredoxin subunit